MRGIDPLRGAGEFSRGSRGNPRILAIGEKRARNKAATIPEPPADTSVREESLNEYRRNTAVSVSFITLEAHDR